MQSTQALLLLQLAPAAAHLAVNHFTKGQGACPVSTLIPDAAGAALSIPEQQRQQPVTCTNTSSVLRRLQSRYTVRDSCRSKGSAG